MNEYKLVDNGEIILFPKNVFIHDYELNRDNFFMLPQYAIEAFQMEHINNIYLCRFSYKDFIEYSFKPVDNIDDIKNIECLELKHGSVENARYFLRNQAGFIFAHTPKYDSVILYSTSSTDSSKNLQYLPLKDLINDLRIRDGISKEFDSVILSKAEDMVKQHKHMVFNYSFYDPALLTAANIWFEDLCPRINYNPTKNKLVGAVLSRDATAQHLGIRSFGVPSSIWTRDYDLPVIDKSLVFSLVSDIRSIIENDLER